MPLGLNLTLHIRGSAFLRGSSREPQLVVVWEARRRNFASSVRAVLRGPKAPKGFPATPYFHDSWVRSSWPGRALVASALWHAVFLTFSITFPLAIWKQTARRAQLKLPQIEVTWYEPIRDLPTLKPLASQGAPAEAVPSLVPREPALRRDADAFHPRQRILSAPPGPMHPRQTLIQPAAPLEPPKILPQLPNIVRWAQTAEPARPRLRISPHALAKLRPATPVSRPRSKLPAPNVPNLERQVSELNIASNAMNVPQPQLTLAPGSLPRSHTRASEQDAGPAPDIRPAGDAENGFERLLALSATPAPNGMNLAIPAGNLAARFSISPDGRHAGAPGGSSNEMPGSTGGTAKGGNGVGPPGISISSGNPSEASAISGLSNPAASAPTDVGRAMPATPEPRSAAVAPSHTPLVPGFEPIRPGAPPETIFGPRHIYTLHVNMPNLASATGSWILSFVELYSGGESGPRARSHHLSGPVPVRKVDPRYPPALINARVQGEVVLYAIIRKDGSVDSIQVVRGLEPQLDSNAMAALARWKFRPAERQGAPVELETIVRIPFRAVAPGY